MRRRRWVRVTWPIEMRELAKRLQSNLFSGENQSGFVIDRARESFLEARFIERIDFNEPLIDPIGRELQSGRVEFYQTRFIASTLSLGLEIVDSNKGMRSFVNRISAICDDNLSLSSLSVDVGVWGQAFEGMTEKKFFTDSIQLSDLAVATMVKAKIVFSGSVDVRSAAAEFVGGRNHRVEKLRLSTADKPRLSVLLTNNGTAATFGNGDEVLIANIRDSLASIVF